jgi:hypothetical protein
LQIVFDGAVIEFCETLQLNISYDVHYPVPRLLQGPLILVESHSKGQR